MKKTTFQTLALAAALLLGIVPALAEDIDIFSGGTANGVAPNVLILVDSAASNDAAFSSPACPYAGIGNSKLMDSVQCALATAADAIRNQPAILGKLRIGMMVYGAGSNQGGLWVSPATPPSQLPLMDTTGINNFLSLVEAGYPKSNSRAAPGLFQESWAFFTGGVGLSGTSYASHITLSCQKSFIIFIGAASKQGSPAAGNGNVDLSGTTATAAQKVQINTSNLGPYTGDDSAWTDEWARYLYQTDFGPSLTDTQNVVTYTIAATGNNPDPTYVQHLASTAYQGGGKPFVAADVNSMVKDLIQIFNEVAAVNSVFASSSLPIASNTQGSYQNQVFIGMFRPDAEGNPRWMGNLKQYQFGVSGTPPNVQLFLADATGAEAISAAGTGFITPTAQSFWTSKNSSKLPDSIGGFWVNDPQGNGGGYDMPDGEIVEKGGVAQQLRLANLQDAYDAAHAATPRNVYTCTSSGGLCGAGASLSATPFATSNTDLTNAVLGVTPPSYGVSSISRNGATVTMTLSSVPSPAMTNGQSVTVQGAANAELNGTFTITLVNSTTFTYTITETPPSPSTGTYTATVPSSPKNITTLTRSGTTVTATTSVAHGYVNGDSVTISGASGAQYNGTFTVSGVTATTFQYTIVDAPAAATTGGTADIGSTHTNAINFTVAQITRDATHSNNTSIVTVTSSSNLPAAYAAGAKVNVSSVTPSGYVVSLASITNTGNSCPGGSNKKSFCYSINTTPVSPDNGANKKVDRTATASIASLTHPVACTAGSATATVTATTAAAHPFVTNDVVSIAGNPVGPNESAYVGSFSITKTSSTTFTYPITTSPPCTPSASGVSVITGSGGVDKTELIYWVRGYDDIGDEPSPSNPPITIRPSVHGDVIHSRPAVVNYPSQGVVVFYGSNDGVFRAINGNQTASIGSVPPGGELWSFIPAEFFSKLSRLYLNSPALKLANTPTGITPTPLPKNYFFDGVTGVYQNTATGTYYIYLSARRGGRLIYALDVSDPTNPKFMWKRANTDAGFAELGYTWSTPKAAMVKGWSNPVLIFGGGYDPNEDSEPPTADTMGRSIFILDATNGNILWQAKGGGSAVTCSGNPCLLGDMTYAVAADVALLDRFKPDGTKPDGFVDRLYAADMGGNIWRVDLEPPGGNDPGHWQATKFAALGGTGATKRKFLYPPDVVTTAKFDTVLAGTGDREHPLYQNGSYSVVNRFYMIKDTNIGDDGSSWTAVADSTSNTADNQPAGLFHVVLPTPPNPVYDMSGSGFYITLPNTGEKVVNAPTTIGGFTYFGTNQPIAPASLSCSSGLGVARDYQVNFITGSTVSGVLDTGGLPPSPVAGLVNVPDSAGDTLLVPFLIGGNPSSTCTGPDCRSSLGAVRPPIPIGTRRSRLYWYIDKLDK